MILEEQVRQHKEISLKIEELEAQKKILGESILQSMECKSIKLGSYLVRRCSRVSISSTIEEARQFEATKMEEVVDKDKLKDLYKQIGTIPGVKTIEYIQITENK
jgi:hypothetical protein